LTIAALQWPSAAILAHIHAQILSENLGCEVQVVAGELGATTSSIATTGTPDVVPELWAGRVASVWNSAVAAQKVRPAAPTFDGGPFEGWFVPDYVVKNNPGLGSVLDLNAYWQVFSKPGADRGTLVSCPEDWACAIINANMLKAFGLERRFEIVQPKDRFTLDQTIGAAISKHQPLLFYYWQPNGLVSRLNLAPLDMGAFDADAMACLANRACEALRPSSFGHEDVVIAVTERVFADAPRVATYFERATMPIAEMNAALAWQNAAGASAADTAAHFVAERGDIWRKWIGEQ